VASVGVVEVEERLDRFRLVDLDPELAGVADVGSGVGDCGDEGDARWSKGSSTCSAYCSSATSPAAIASSGCSWRKARMAGRLGSTSLPLASTSVHDSMP
jgi:hypothetical protein